jgi:hypothetical protein
MPNTQKKKKKKAKFPLSSCCLGKSHFLNMMVEKEGDSNNAFA